MADKKISALTAASTPLAGTEVLPIVQSGATVKVAVSDLTAGRAIAATSITTDTYKAASSSGGALQNSGGTPQLQWGAGGGNNLSVDVAININPANAAVAISPTGTGTVTINPATASTINNMSIGATTASTGRFTSVTATTGNVVIGTSGQGIDFSATPGTGTSELLADYEEGTWTPIDSSGAGLTLSVTAATYTKIGRQVTCWANLSYPVTASGAVAVIGGLPFTSIATFGGGAIQGVFAARTFTITSSGLYGGSSATTMNIEKNGVAVATNLDLSASAMYFVVNYTV